MMGVLRSTLVSTVSVLTLVSAASAGPSLLNNTSFESGSLDPVTGHHVASAADYWYQWINSNRTSGVLTTELITNAEMQAGFGVGVIDGDRAFRVTTSGASDGAYTLASWHSPGWSTNSTMTFSAWVYTVSGVSGVWHGSNADGFQRTESATTGAWEFLSVTIPGGRLNNEPLLYSVNGAADFIVDAAWLNYGDRVENPAAPAVPVPTSLGLVCAGLVGLARRRRAA